MTGLWAAHPVVELVRLSELVNELTRGLGEPTRAEQALTDALHRPGVVDLDTPRRAAEEDRAWRASWATRPDALCRAALAYAGLGVPVFPLLPGDKRPVLPSAHPAGNPLRGECHGGCGRDGHGFYDATVDQDRIVAWWRARPHANVGVPTGHAFDVVDIDGPDAAGALFPHLDELRGVGRAVSLTPRGLHLWIPATGVGNATGMYPHVDYRGIGGYVVAPPSRTVATYAWATPLPWRLGNLRLRGAA